MTPLKKNVFLFFIFFLQKHVLYFIQCVCFSLMLTSNFRINVLEAIQMVQKVSGFGQFFVILIIIHPVYMVSPCSSLDSGQSYDILNFADVFVVYSTLQSVADDAP